MNDRFLHQFRKAPPRRLVEGLYGRISQLPGSIPEPRVQTLPSGRTATRMGWMFGPLRIPKLPAKFQASGIVAICLVLTIVAVTSPTIRAQFAEVVRTISGLTIKQTEVYPGDADKDITIIPEQTLSLDEARETVSFAFGLPTWVPEGFVLQKEAVLFAEEPFLRLSLKWVDSTGSGRSLNLDVAQANTETTWVVGPDSVEVTEVNGQPAAIIRGGWDYDAKEWSQALEVLTLRWRQGEVEYLLTMYGGRLSMDDLTRVAESVQ